MYYLFLAGQQAGPFDLAYLQTGWKNGTLTGETLFWQEGMTEWQPLSAIREQLEESPASSAAPSSLVQAGGPMIIGGFWRRLAAFLIDVLLIGIFGFGSGYFLYDLYTELGLAGLLVGLAVATAYFGLLNSRLGCGQTIGKRLLGLRVVNAQGDLISPNLSVVRYLILACPFFLNKALSDGIVTSLWPVCLLSLPIVAGFLAFTYLLIFNRRTRQLVHDLIVKTYVVRTTSPQPALAPGMWRGHAMAMSALGVLVLAFLCAVPLLMQLSIFKETMAVRQAILNTGVVQSATVTGGTTYVASTEGVGSTRVLTILAHLAGLPKNSDAFAAKFAKAAIDADPNIGSYNRIDVSISYGYDIGIASGVVTDQFQHSPDEWKTLGPTP